MRAIALLGVIFFGNVQIVQAASIDFEIAQVSPVTDAQPLRRIFKVPLRDDGMSGPHHKARHFRKRAIAFRAGKPRYWGCVAFVANATGFSGLAGNGKGMADSLQREKGYRPSARIWRSQVRGSNFDFSKIISGDLSLLDRGRVLSFLFPLPSQNKIQNFRLVLSGRWSSFTRLDFSSPRPRRKVGTSQQLVESGFARVVRGVTAFYKSFERIQSSKPIAPMYSTQATRMCAGDKSSVGRTVTRSCEGRTSN